MNSQIGLMQNECMIKASVSHYIIKTDFAPHTILLVVLWDSWASISQDTMINCTRKKYKQSLCPMNSISFSLLTYANETFKIIINN